MEDSIRNNRVNKRSIKLYARDIDIHSDGILQRIVRILIAIYFFTAFFEPYLNIELGSIMKYYLVFIMVSVVLLHRAFSFQWYHATLISWFVIKLVSVLWSDNLYLFRQGLFSHIGMTVLTIIITSMYYDEKLNRTIMKTMLYGSASIGILSVFFNGAYEGVSTRQVLVLFGYGNDPNNQTAFLVIGVAASLHYLITLKKNKFIYYAIIVVNVYSTFMTGSRTGLVAIGLIAMYAFLFSDNETNIRSMLRKVTIILTIFIAGFICVKILLPDEIYYRLFSFYDYQSGSGRVILWKNAYELLRVNLNFIFGAGWGSYWGFNGVYRVLHNTYISILCDTGIIGFILMFLPFFVCFRKFYKTRQVGLNCMILATFVSIFFLEAINKRFFWNVLILIILYYKSYIKEVNDKYYGE